MKAVLLLLPFLLNFFLPQGQEEVIREIRFESFARGYQKTITLRPDSILYSEQNPKTGNIEACRATKKDEWNQLTQAVDGLALKDISDLKAPGMDRASDRVLHSRVTIKTNRGEYTSREFDGYNAPRALLPLVEQIRKIENTTQAPDAH